MKQLNLNRYSNPLMLTPWEKEVIAEYKFGFFYGEAAKSQSPKDQQSHGQPRGRDFDDGRTL